MPKFMRPMRTSVPNFVEAASATLCATKACIVGMCNNTIKVI